MELKTIAVSLSAILILTGCGSSNKGKVQSGNTGTADMIVTTFITERQSYINATNGSNANIDDENGLESSPTQGVFTHNGFVYTTGGLANNKIAKYKVQADNSLKLVKEIVTKQSGTAAPTTFTFIDDTKAYLPLAGAGELLDINLEDFSIRERIDLSDYAMDANLVLHKDGGSDTSPEPSGTAIRNGKLYLALGQMTGIEHGDPNAFLCRGLASALIIDIATNNIEKHITDDRTCSSGAVETGSTLALTDNGDIYINHVASYGYITEKPPGYLRIKAGEDNFDPDYFFNIRDGLDLSADFPDMNASLAKSSYVYKERYHNGVNYITMRINGLITDPNDYIGSKDFQPYTLDLPNKTATKLDMLPTNGWSAQVSLYNDKIVYPQATESVNGLYYVNEKIPFMTTLGQPLFVMDLDK